MRATICYIAFLLMTAKEGASQQFARSELPTQLLTPWEITYGPDDYLWLTEEGGRVVRVSPLTGEKKIVYTAPDYSQGHPSECCQLCYNPEIGKGTLGLALHPDFLNAGASFIYFVHSYNNGSDSLHQTRFKICRLEWDHAKEQVVNAATIVSDLPTGYDHLGGRLMVVRQGGVPFLFLSVGDNGVSETNFPGCYDPDSLNPNNKCQDPVFKSGKIHRFNMDGTIPSDNPLPGNSFYTRGHRNPQGLMYDPVKEVLYDVEHGDRTDDEINVLKKGMNYGWKQVRGYHTDINHPGEDHYVSSYKPHPGIVGDQLVEPLYSWCAVSQHTASDNTYWGTVAPSDGVYYGSDAIPGFQNSLLVVTLKKGKHSHREVYRFRLNDEGTGLAPSTISEPNPKKYFTDDEPLNGRLRDIAVSPDGRVIYLINNSGADRDKIIVYTFDGAASSAEPVTVEPEIRLFPNPCGDYINISCSARLEETCVYNQLGQKQRIYTTPAGINVSALLPGAYVMWLRTADGHVLARRLVKN